MTRPSPPHVGQAFRSLPVPPQRGQVRLNFIAPAIWSTWPVPLHCGQAGVLPPAEPVPWQVSQISWRVMLSRTCVPLMACQKSMFSTYSRSRALFAERACVPVRRLAPKNWREDIAEAAASCLASAAPPRCAPPVAARYSEKSKPPKSMFGPPALRTAVRLRRPA